MKKKIVSLLLSLVMVCGFIIPAAAEADVSEETLEAIVTDYLNEKYDSLVEEVGDYASDKVEEMLQDPEFVAAVIKAGVKAYIYAFLYQAGVINDELMLYAGDAVDKAVDMMVTNEVVTELLKYPFVQDVIKTTAELTVEELVRKSGIIEDRDALIKQCVEDVMSSTSSIYYNTNGKYEGSKQVTVNSYWEISGTYKTVKVRTGTILGFIPVYSNYDVYSEYAVTGWNQSKIEDYCGVCFIIKTISGLSKYYTNINNISQAELYKIIFDSMGEAVVEEFNNLVAAVIENPAAAFNYYLAQVLSEKLGYDVTLDENDPVGDIINKIIAASVAAAENGETPTLPGVLGTSCNQALNAALAFVPAN